MRKSRSISLVAIVSFCSWFFTSTDSGKRLWHDTLARVSQGQYGSIGQVLGGQNQSNGGGYYNNYNTYGANTYSQPPYTGGQYPGGQSAGYQPQPVPAIPASYGVPNVNPTPPPPTPLTGGPAIHIATFNIQVFGDAKASKSYVMATLANIIRNFDIVAIQEIRTQDDYFIDNFLRTYVNTNGRTYDKVVGPRLGRSVSKEQYAYIYDTATIEVNKRCVFTVNDPDDLLEREPLVAMFRVRGPPPDQAFTFVLADVHTRPEAEFVQKECDTLAQVYQVVRRACGGEDDIIMLGDFNNDDQHLGEFTRMDCMPIVRNTPTNTRRNHQEDNIIIHRQSTTEFSGKWGVFDFPRMYNLTTDQALLVSDHMPVWAEFNAYESVTPGRVATNPAGVPMTQ